MRTIRSFAVAAALAAISVAPMQAADTASPAPVQG
jgi:hypothetical protein